MRKSSVSNATATLIRIVVQVDSGDRLEGRPVNRALSTESPDFEAFELRVFSYLLGVRKNCTIILDSRASMLTGAGFVLPYLTW